MDERVRAQLPAVREQHDLGRPLEREPLRERLRRVGRREAVLERDGVRADERPVHVDVLEQVPRERTDERLARRPELAAR